MWVPTTPRTSALSPWPTGCCDQTYRMWEGKQGPGWGNRKAVHTHSIQASCTVCVVSGKPQPLSPRGLLRAPQLRPHTAVLSTRITQGSQRRCAKDSALGGEGSRCTRGHKRVKYTEAPGEAKELESSPAQNSLPSPGLFRPSPHLHLHV